MKWLGEPSRDPALPQVGTFRIRLVKNGPWVAARITYGPALDEDGQPMEERSFYWAASIDHEADPSPAPAPNERVLRVWTHGERIDEAEFRFLLARAEYSRAYDPAAPEASPRQRVDLRAIRPLF